MFENFIELNAGRLLKNAEFPAGNIYLKDISASDYFEEAYKQFFNSEIGWRVYQSHLQIQSTPNFDLDSPKAEIALDKLAEIFKENAKFVRKEYTDLIYSAVSLRLNYLVRPVNTLKFFLFGYAPTKPLKEVLLKLDFFDDYRYLTDGLRDAINSKQIGAKGGIISLPEFSLALEKIDTEYFQNLTVEELGRLLIPCFEFFEINCTDSQEPVIPVEALIVFLNDKGITTMTKIIKSAATGPTRNYLTKNSIIDIFDSVLGNMDDESIVEEFDEIVEPHYLDEIDENDEKFEDSDEQYTESADVFDESTDIFDESANDDFDVDDEESIGLDFREEEEEKNLSADENFDNVAVFEDSDLAQQIAELENIDLDLLMVAPGMSDLLNREIVSGNDNIAEMLNELEAELELTEPETDLKEADNVSEHFDVEGELIEPDIEFEQISQSEDSSFESDMDQSLGELAEQLGLTADHTSIDAISAHEKYDFSINPDEFPTDTEKAIFELFEEVMETLDEADSVIHSDPIIPEVNQTVDIAEEKFTPSDDDSYNGEVLSIEKSYIETEFDSNRLPIVDEDKEIEYEDIFGHAEKIEEELLPLSVEMDEMFNPGEEDQIASDTDGKFNYGEYLKSAKKFEYKTEVEDICDLEDIINLYEPVINKELGSSMSDFGSGKKDELRRELDNFFEEFNDRDK